MDIAKKEHEIIEVPLDMDKVMCDGGHPVLGHPAVFYSFDEEDEVICQYCNRKFIK